MDFFTSRFSHFPPTVSRVRSQCRRADHSLSIPTQHLRNPSSSRRPNNSRRSSIRCLLNSSFGRHRRSMFGSPHEVLLSPVRSGSTHGRTLQASRSRHSRASSSNSSLPPPHSRQQVPRPLEYEGRDEPAGSSCYALRKKLRANQETLDQTTCEGRTMVEIAKEHLFV